MTEVTPSQTSPDSDVFVSYASPDAAVANTLVEALESRGIKCWIAPRDVTPGAFYADAIVEAINASRILVVVMTQNAVASTHVLREVERASAKRHPVVSLRIDSAPLPTGLEYFLSASHWLDASASGIDAVLPKLADAVRRLIAPPSGADPSRARDAAKGAGDLFPQRPAFAKAGQRTRRSLIAATGVIALVAAYVIVNKLWLSRPVVAELPAAAGTSAAIAAPAAISDQSIAVLPFVDMSEKHDQEYFSDGLSEELIDHLAHNVDLKVIARTSSFAFKGKNEDMRSIATKLGVANLLEGSVRKAGGTLRITAQLIRAADGVHRWSETYDRNLNDIFKVQDEISTTVAKALNVALNVKTSDGALPASKGTGNMEAYNLFLQGKYLNARGSEEEGRRAVELLKRSVELDPSFAAAWAELAGSYYLLAYNVENRSPGIEAGRAAIQRALALNPADADTHYLLAGIKLTFDHDWSGAFAEMDAGRRANPEITDFLGPLVAGCVSGPCYGKKIHDLSRDIGRDPLNPGAWEVRGFYRYCVGELEAAEADLRRALDLSPDSLDGKWDLVVTLVAHDKLAEALTIVESMPDSSYRRAGFALAYQRLGRKTEADAALQELLSKNSKDGSYEIAQVYSARGEVTSALDWLQRDYDLRLNGIIYAKVDPLLRPLAHNPRFIALMKKFAPT